MKTHPIKKNMQSKSQVFIAALLAGGLAALSATPATLRAEALPNVPLLTAGEAIAPNIMFILDDSGSMAWDAMPAGSISTDLRDFAGRNFLTNTIYYDPRKTYQAWMGADGVRMTAGTSYNAVLGSFNLAVGHTVDLSNPYDCKRFNVDSSGGDFFGACDSGHARTHVRGGVQTFFYPKNPSTIPTMTAAQRDNLWLFYRFQILTDGRVVRSEGMTGPNRNVAGIPKWVQGPAGSGVGCDEAAGSATSGLGSWQFGNCTFITPTGRSEAQERANYAVWFSYHRTRMKAAKAGASEAFASLGANYRVGFDTIWNVRNTAGLNSNTPLRPIPVTVNKGLFSETNKEEWFDAMQSVIGRGGTPLHGALARTGRYYETYGKGGVQDPWGDGELGTLRSCRASYALLTTDGFWNNGSGYISLVGNTDGDNFSNTLADVAMYYFNRDLREDMPDLVGATHNGERHQRMTTFGISIGASGSLPGPPAAPPASNAWPNPWAGGRTGTETPLNYGGDNNRRIDDLWHAAVNTEGSFVVASDTEAFANALNDAFRSIDGRQASGSNLASNGPETTAGSVKYSALYHSSEWWGDLRAFGRDVETNTYSDSPLWRMSDVANADTHFSTTRPVFTWKLGGGGGGETFVNEYASDMRFQRDGVTISENLAYLRGVRTNEGNGQMRVRGRSAVGDIVHSTPVYVGDSQHVFVGANDGMLHAVNALNGKVSFSYVPRGIDMDALASLSKPDYQHRFFVDGQITVGRRQSGNKQTLVAALGRGGKGVFGLDVGAPAEMANNKISWDNTFQPGASGSHTHSDMGYVLGKVAVTYTKTSSHELALVPNGINSDTGQAALFVYRADNGSLQARLPVGDAGSNGLMVIETADLDRDGKVDLVYGGDLQGNVWRWDFRTTTNPTGHKIFTAKDQAGNPQAITGGLAVTRESNTGNIFVAFGTGRLLTNDDLPWNSAQGQQRQSLYGIIDNLQSDGTQTIAAATTGADRYSELTKRTIPYTGKDSLGRDARAFEHFKPLPEDSRGWFVDLGVPSPFADYERVVSNPVVAGRALWISSIWPTEGDGCDAPMGNGYLTALDVFTGTNTSTNTAAGNTNGSGTTTFIDVNADGDGNDRLVGSDSLADTDGFITSVAFGETIGSPDVSDIEVHVQGGGGGLNQVARIGGRDGQPRRLMWRELFRNR